jgi:hypothetical protein
MKKSLVFILCIAPAFACLHAQQSATSSQLLRPMESLSLGESTGGGSATLKSGTTPAKQAATSGTQQAKGPTDITCTKEATFDDKSRKAIFIGDVHVKDPQFTMTADKLTAFIRREAISSGTAAAATPAPSRSGTSSAAKNVPGAGGLEKAVAEGHVVIVQDKPGENGGEPQHSVAKAGRAEFHTDTGEMILTIWPQVQQGINLHLASEESTVMVIYNDGRMKTEGRSRTLIQEQPEASAKTQTPSSTP